MALSVILADVQITDHPSTSETHLVGVFDKPDDQLLNLIFEAGQRWPEKRVSVRRVHCELNEIGPLLRK